VSLATRASEGVHRISVPTPFAVGAVNCYLIEDEPLTLLDTGPNSGTALDALEQGLGSLGHRPEDLGLILLTHQHLDHIGLLEVLVRRSGAEVAALHTLGPWLERFPDSARADDHWAQALMRRHGVPPDLVSSLRMVAAAFRPYGSSGRLTRPLRDGEVVALAGRSLRALHRPGHSPTDTVFWEQERGLLLAGDHLLAHISSNAILSPTPGETADPDGPRPRPLLQYVSSLKATRELGAELVLGGHGDPIHRPAELIESRLRMHRRRAAKILTLLAEGPLSAYEIAQRMWGNVAVTQAYLTLSEVLGHLDLLLEDGAVRECDGGPIRFQATGSPPADEDQGMPADAQLP
jgi:glyoxylase-like metal-dependent hydrolase (beta-lactamase superfamily II)